MRIGPLFSVREVLAQGEKGLMEAALEYKLPRTLKLSIVHLPDILNADGVFCCYGSFYLLSVQF